MRKICFNPKTPSFSIDRLSLSSLVAPSPSTSTSSPRTPRVTNIPDSGNTDEEKCIEEAETLILKWNADNSAYAKVTSLFYEDKTEANQYITCVKQLQKAMHSLLSHNPSSQKLIHAQHLMQMAMKRLRKEFYQILSMNRAHLDPESVSVRSSRTSVRSNTSENDDDSVVEDDDVRATGDSISELEQVSSVVMADLKSIADCMISSGYAKECVSVYNSIRKSIVDEGIYRLNVDKLSASRVNKMDWEVLELKINNWLEAVTISVRTLFVGERILCVYVLGSSDSILRESCFAEISKDCATLLFGFPEFVAKTKKSPPEKMFRVLDMYAVLTALWPEIESIFSSDSTSAVRSQVLASLQQLIEAVQTMLMEFESTLTKDSSKLPVNGGGVNSLTIQTMNYLVILSNYSNALADIFLRADLPSLPKSSSLPESYLYSPESVDSTTPAMTARVTWLILVLLCKLDAKVKLLKDVSLSYLFLANNLRHVVVRVRNSNLQYVLGEDWIMQHEAKIKKFIANYERVAWGEVISSLPENPTPSEAREVFENFNFRFEEAYRKQNSFVIADREMRDEIKGSIARKIVPRYRQWYNTVLATVGSMRNMAMIEYVTFTPEDVDNYLSNLFFFGTSSSCVSSPSSVTSSPNRQRS